MLNTENNYHNVIIESFIHGLVEELEKDIYIRDFLLEKGLVRDEGEVAGCILDWVISLLESVGFGWFQIHVLHLKYQNKNSLDIGYKTYLKHLFDIYKNDYFYKKCGDKFLLDSNLVINPTIANPIEGEVERDKVGLAAMASVASYSKNVVKESYPTDAFTMEYNLAESAFRRAIITMPTDVDQGDTPTPEKILELFQKEFSVKTLTTKGCGLALLIDGTFKTNGIDHYYYIIAIRGTYPTPLKDRRNLPKSPGVEAWVETLYNATFINPIDTIDLQLQLFFRMFLKGINPTDGLNNILAEPVDFVLPKGQKLKDCDKSVHEGFYTKALDMYSALALKPEEATFNNNKTLEQVLSDITKDDTHHLIITGHSQGAANALALTAMIRFAVKQGIFKKECVNLKIEQLDKKLELITFAQPMVGNAKFVNACLGKGEEKGREDLRIDNNYTQFMREGDLVPLVPGASWNSDKAVPFEKMKFEQTGLNPIGALKDGVNIENLFAMLKMMGTAHNASLYLKSVCDYYAPSFYTRWKTKFPQ